jgi:uncharacterized ubiquitin-like protein YukD
MFVVLGADSKEYVGDQFSFNSSDYHQGQKAIAPEALVVEPKEDDGMFIKKKNDASTSSVSWLLLVSSMVLLSSFF